MISEMTSTALLFTRLETPIGELLLFGDGDALSGIQLPGRHGPTADARSADAGFERPVAQLHEYFAGDRTEFLTLAPAGGDFYHRVWDEVARIPYGDTATYGQVAAAIGAPRRLPCRRCGQHPLRGRAQRPLRGRTHGPGRRVRAHHPLRARPCWGRRR